MTDPEALVATRPSDPNLKRLPDFSLSLWTSDDDPSEVEVIVHVKEDVDPTQRASAALIHGLVILALDHQGILQQATEKMFPNGFPTETQVVDHITLLLEQEINAQPV
jgi:hypothetical protein